MKFKEAYKSMTDEIHGDKALLNRILNGETKKKSFFEKFSHSYAFAGAVACILIMCTVFVSYTYFSPATEKADGSSSDIVSDDASTPMMVRQIEVPSSDSTQTNGEYYGEILADVFSLTSDSHLSSVSEENVADPLTIFLDYPSKEAPSEIMISKTCDLSKIAPDATTVTLDGISIAVTSATDADENDILDKLSK